MLLSKAINALLDINLGITLGPLEHAGIYVGLGLLMWLAMASRITALRLVAVGVLLITIYGIATRVGQLLNGLLLIAVIVFERLWPRSPIRRLSNEAMQGGACLAYKLLGATVVMAGLSSGLPLPSGTSFELASTGLPFGLQVVAISLAADLGIYVVHRAQHHFGFYWKFHALHHSVRELSALAGSKTNILEWSLIQFFAVWFVAAHVLGVSPEAVGLAGTFSGLVSGPLSHSNLDLPGKRFQWLNYLIVTPNYHGTHHSLATAHRDRNFAEVWPVWDLLFGTFVMPTQPPQEFGIDDMDFSERGLVYQHAFPFLPARRRPEISGTR